MTLPGVPDLEFVREIVEKAAKQTADEVREGVSRTTLASLATVPASAGAQFVQGSRFLPVPSGTPDGVLLAQGQGTLWAREVTGPLLAEWWGFRPDATPAQNRAALIAMISRGNRTIRVNIPGVYQVDNSGNGSATLESNGVLVSPLLANFTLQADPGTVRINWTNNSQQGLILRAAAPGNVWLEGLDFGYVTPPTTRTDRRVPFGIRAVGTALSRVADVGLLDCRSYNSPSAGVMFDMHYVDNYWVQGCQSISAQADGLQISGSYSTNPQVLDNIVRENGDDGISLNCYIKSDGFNPNHKGGNVRGNKIYNAGGRGLYFGGCNYTDASGNHVFGSRSANYMINCDDATDPVTGQPVGVNRSYMVKLHGNYGQDAGMAGVLGGHPADNAHGISQGGASQGLMLAYNNTIVTPLQCGISSNGPMEAVGNTIIKPGTRGIESITAYNGTQSGKILGNTIEESTLETVYVEPADSADAVWEVRDNLARNPVAVSQLQHAFHLNPNGVAATIIAGGNTAIETRQTIPGSWADAYKIRGGNARVDPNRYLNHSNRAATKKYDAGSDFTRGTERDAGVATIPAGGAEVYVPHTVGSDNLAAIVEVPQFVSVGREKTRLRFVRTDGQTTALTFRWSAQLLP